MSKYAINNSSMQLQRYDNKLCTMLCTKLTSVKTCTHLVVFNIAQTDLVDGNQTYQLNANSFSLAQFNWCKSQCFGTHTFMTLLIFRAMTREEHPASFKMSHL